MLLPPHLFCVFRYIRPRAAYAVCEEAGKTARAACFSRAAPLVYPHPPANAVFCFTRPCFRIRFTCAVARGSKGGEERKGPLLSDVLFYSDKAAHR